MKNLFILFITISTLASCSKKVSELPAPSENGSNTFGAKIDGKMWAPQGFGIMPTAPTLEANLAGGNSYKINARNFGSSPTETEFEIIIRDVTGPGVYMLNKTTPVYPGEIASYALYVKRRLHPQNEWITSPSLGGKVTITKLDLPNKIIAGTFEFQAADQYGTASPINVTEGRFDLKIN